MSKQFVYGLAVGVVIGVLFAGALGFAVRVALYAAAATAGVVVAFRVMHRSKGSSAESKS